MRVAAAGLVTAYRYTVGPLLATLGNGVAGAPRCKYHPSCSQYAADALRTHGLVRGCVLAAWRLARCNPWSHGGIDRVEDQRLFRRPT
jgi:putative membrane protein insertion efficiency factor